MNKSYVVRPGIRGYLVLRETKDVNGKIVKVDITDCFNSKEEADAKCRLSNYIVLKAREACKELAGAK